MDQSSESAIADKEYGNVTQDITNPETDILKLDDEVDPLNKKIIEAELTAAGDEIGLVEEEEDHGDDIELSPGGVLDEETITRGLSNLGNSASGESQVYLNVTIPGFSLTDISLLSQYEHVQKVELPHNDITDISPLGKLPHLLILDVSHNKLNSLLNCKPHGSLQEVNLSYNKIKQLENLSTHPCLRKLIVDNNELSAISGLQHCKRLNYLSLAHNKIEAIEGLDNLPIQHLNLSNNGIYKILNLNSLKLLRNLNLSGNNIRSLSGLDHNALLQVIDLEDNEVIDIIEMNHIQKARNLRDVNLLRNPVQELPDYRLSILFRISRLTTLDRQPVKAEEKVAAINMFNPPKEVVTARDHIMHAVYSFLQPSRVWDSTLPSIETPYPMLVLVGPQGSGKKELAMRLVNEFGDYFGLGLSHTTRRPRTKEVSGKEYYFVSQEKFEMDVKMGQFIQTCQQNNNWYGLQMESVEAVAREGLACVVHMELEGVLTLKSTYFEPRYVLIMPLDPNFHESRLRGKDIYTHFQIQKMVKRADLYTHHNQQHPGFFDMMISSDNISAAYKALRRLVMDYLGISPIRTASASPRCTTPAETQDATEGGHFLDAGSRAWSKPSIDSLSQTRGPRTGSGIPVSRGIVEEESIKRRHSAAKEVVSGYVPPLYEQLLTNYPKTAPQSVHDQLGLEGKENTRAYSAPTNQVIDGKKLIAEGIPASPDSSLSKSNSSSNLSDLDSATELQRDNCGKTNSNNSKGLLPTEEVNPLELIDEQGYRSASKEEMTSPRPPSATRPTSRTGVRPGSNRHTVLPPIKNAA